MENRQLVDTLNETSRLAELDTKIKQTVREASSWQKCVVCCTGDRFVTSVLYAVQGTDL